MKTYGIEKVRGDHYRHTKGELPRRTVEGGYTIPDDSYIPYAVAKDLGRKYTEESQPYFIGEGRDNNYQVTLRSANTALKVPSWAKQTDRSLDSEINRNPM